MRDCPICLSFIIYTNINVPYKNALKSINYAQALLLYLYLYFFCGQHKVTDLKKCLIILYSTCQTLLRFECFPVTISKLNEHKNNLQVI